MPIQHQLSQVRLRMLYVTKKGGDGMLPVAYIIVRKMIWRLGGDSVTQFAT